MDFPMLVRRAACATGLMFLVLSFYAHGASVLQTPLEEARYERLTSAAGVGSFLKTLEQRDARARHVVVGKSGDGRPLDALLVSQAISALGRGEPSAGR